MDESNVFEPNRRVKTTLTNSNRPWIIPSKIYPSAPLIFCAPI